MIKTDTWIRAHALELGIDPANINPASVDLRLGGQIVEYRQEPSTGWHGETGPVQEVQYNHHLKEGDSFTFEPGVFYLCHSVETTTLPADVCAQLVLKSSAGRKGLDHAHSGWGDPSFSGQWTFEFVAHRLAAFTVGQRIAQLIFMQCDGAPEVAYGSTSASHYQHQQGVTQART